MHHRCLSIGPPSTQSEDGAALLATVSNVHPSQSGTLVLFLLSEMLTQSHFLHVSGAITRVLWHRLTQMLHQHNNVNSVQQQQYVTLQQLKPYVKGVV